MKLELRKVKVKDIVLGDQMKFADGVLTVDVNGLIAALKEDVNVKDIKVDLAMPGEKTRIIPV